MKRLIGKKIQSVKLNENKTDIEFRLEDGSRILFQAYGDCCSSSWFEHLTGIGALLGHTVKEIIEREMPDTVNDHPEYDCLRFYGWTLVTEAGHADLEMRNSSNGYYGGSVDVHVDRKVDEKLVAVSEDF